MRYKDLLALVLDAQADDIVLKAAEALSNRLNGRVSVTALTALPDEPLAYEPSVVAGVWAELLGQARSEAAADRQRLEARIGGFVTPCELRFAEALARDLGRVAAVHARYADLAILRRPGPDVGDPRHDLAEGVLFHSGRPALIVPPDWAGGPIGAKPLLAWDASRQATRALADAMPLLPDGAAFSVVTVDAKPKAFGHGDQPGANIAGHLSRKGFTADIRNLDGLGRSAAETLLTEARAMGCDLIIMGGYGHARIRELMFGGATRDLLETADVPLLLSH